MGNVGIVFGTRPEAIKMAPVVKQFKTHSKWNTKVIVTGQHREMLDQVLDVFNIIPDYDLDVMTENQSLTDITTAVLNGLEQIFSCWKPDYLLVHGDTTTALAAALAGYYHKIAIAHVEAGLRTGDLYNPFPEEANRKLIDGLSTVFLAPTEAAAKNLRLEGISSKQIYVTGNTVVDALYMVVNDNYQFKLPQLRALTFSKPVVLVTAHRRENWGQPLENICAAIRDAASCLPVDIVFAMHKNPQIQSVVKSYLAGIDNVYLIDAPAYIEFANLLNRCKFLVTDSGGLQEEAAALGKPVLVLRDTTERPEGIESGILKLVGTDKEKIVYEISNLIQNNELYRHMTHAHNPYGDGKAAMRIKNIITEFHWRDVNGN
ncbi:MAG: UDP-N-acetylglucosamine 2-epimerase (non-hydrolyzing) [Firmicutes bacterium]|nr:UDP-N-acetylglucosamine 2-epimerase (non-hydrolyzing) [Bacillota bacterium]